MATLVLTTIGSAVGGPVGGMVGAALGGVIDRQIFAPRPRQGPRLSDLRLQTSTYGSAIPRLYGRTRVAGTVIWATDLKEARSTSGGKGQPKTVSYSYSASFAVALSSRVAGRVGRIWADGKLLRGTAGDFKSATRFRFLTGDPDQPVDPLIAGAVGIAQCPAYRGVAYALFEDMALADYGNRIPSLTFEIIADDDAPDIGSVLRDMLPARFGAESGIALTGYAAEGASVAEAIAPLVELGGLVRGGSAEAIKLAVPGTGVAASVTPAAPVAIERSAEGGVPDPVTLRYYDPARDYQAGAQSANVAGAAERARQIDLPAVLDAAAAQAAAERCVRAALAAAVRAKLRCGLEALPLRPGMAVVAAGLVGGWRVAASEIDGAGVALDLARIAASDGLAGRGAAPGMPVIEPDLPIPPSVWSFVDLPPLGASTGPAMLRIAAAGDAPGWRGADIAIEGGAADGEAVARIARESVIGTATSVLPPASAALLDTRSRVEVELLHPGMALAGVSDAALIAGRNAAMIGDETIQFGSAEQLSPTRWRLGRLLRGRGGSEAAMAGHAPGETFVAIDHAALGEIDPALVAGGGRVTVAGMGDEEPVAREAPSPLNADRPLSPVHGRASVTPAGDVAIAWTRRSRAGWAWSDGIDAPVGEDRELYRVSAVQDAEEVVLGESGTPQFVVAATTLAAAGGAMTVRIRQVGTFATSHPLTMAVSN